jgi:hypothetical protein
MRARSEQLRAQHRRILTWSLGAAAAIHVLVFLLMPTFRAEPLDRPDLELDTIGTVGGANALAEILFRPPILREANGSEWVAPPERVLAAERGIRLASRCTYLIGAHRARLNGRVQLRVHESGRVEVLGLAGSTGNACGDGVIKDVAGALWYHWLPNDRFPAPVELTQPVTLIAVK